MTAEAVEETPLLLTVHRQIGGIKVEHQFVGWPVKRGDELLDRHSAQAVRQCVDQTELPINLTQQQPAGVRGQRAAGEIGPNFLPPETGKLHRLAITVCHDWPPCLWTE